jgi:hypothetical protein
MRLSAYPQSEFYYGRAMQERGVDPHLLECYVNGVRRDDVVAASSVEGWAEVLRRDASGAFVENEARDAILTETIRGEVTFCVAGEPLR